ncbi:hypothetical protein [Enterovibrio coralii]|uniref:Uncharacterized protein n=1 Tax=Enterovibrio coralii TaxID=294935 RepID=A0A135I738_9GAMM|nr:hypothetical protein [Enterovibrio coralii]KXF81271.1 hypothetical protein ATN88_00520 [Enterovibrio coralii]
MKKIFTLVAALGFAFSMSFTTQANDSGWATQTGPLVMCDLPDGSTDYLPTLICTNNGGSFDPNVGQQW